MQANNQELDLAACTLGWSPGNDGASLKEHRVQVDPLGNSIQRKTVAARRRLWPCAINRAVFCSRHTAVFPGCGFLDGIEGPFSIC
jgi:hypothetical protein